ncbi:hypothetical protein Tco_0340758 [Tanacetum coccineum]
MQTLEEKQNDTESMQVLLLQLSKDLQTLGNTSNQIHQEEQAAKICTPYWKCPIFDNDDDKEYTIQVREYYKNSPVAITPDFPITNSLIMKDEHLNIIPEMKSDEENDDDESSSDEDVPKENFKIYSNPLFDEEFISTKIDSHHFNAESDLIESLLNKDTVITFPKIDFLLEEFADELALINLISPGIAETNFDPKEDIRLIKKLLYDNSSPRPPKVLNSEIFDAIIESFSSSPIPVKDSDSLMEEIDIFLVADDSIPPGIDSDGYDSEEDNLFLEYEPDPGELTRVVVGDIFGEPRVHMPNVLPTHPTLCQDLDFTLSTDFNGSDLVVSFPSKNRNRTFDPGISIEVQSKRFLSLNKFSISFISDPFSLVLETLLLFSSEIEDKVFNPGILVSKEEKSPHLLSHQGFKAFKHEEQDNSQYWKPPVYYSDDDDDFYKESIDETPPSDAIAPNLPITDSLVMEDENLDTIQETNSDEEIESSVKNLNLTPSESEDLSDYVSECDLPFCDNSPNFNNDSEIFSNPFFDSNDDYTSSDDESSFEENVLINPLYKGVLEDLDSIPSGNENDHFNVESDLIESFLNKDTVITSPKIDFLLEEFAELNSENDFEKENNGSTTIHTNISLLEYESFDDKSDSASEIFNNDLAHIISPTEYEYVYADDESDSGDFNTDVVEDILGDSTRKLQISHRGFRTFKIIHNFLNESLMMIYGGDIPIWDVPYLHFYPP